MNGIHRNENCHAQKRFLFFYYFYPYQCRGLSRSSLWCCFGDSGQLQSHRSKDIASSGLKYTGAWDACKKITLEEGIQGFWKGNWSAIWLYVSYSAVQFASYSYFSNWLRTKWREDDSSHLLLPSFFFHPRSMVFTLAALCK
ncbi:hypothetical protein HMI56_005191 [Coelomomyces lativittatus]|nr:hypothetical protein HMI56_005191 [Coelomomyces lativittatus]